MRINKQNLYRPLTRAMIESLMDCHEAQLMSLDPFEAGCFPHSKGLLNRGLVEMKSYTSVDGKRYMGLYVTQAGIDYLQGL